MFSRTSRNFAFTLLAASAILAGCSDAPGPTAPGSELKPNLALGENEGSVAEFGKIKVCKTGNVSGVFTVTRVAEGGDVGSVLPNPTILANTCQTVALDGGPGGVGSWVTITETSAGLVSISGTRIDLVEGVPTTKPINPDFVNGGSLFVNSVHGAVLTFDNFVEPPPPPSGCTYTKGWYQNKNGSPTVVGYDGRSKEDAQAIFNATPGRPGTVTWEGKNLLLNLYQQLLAALENLAGDEAAGPDDVDAAIAAALAGTGGAGTAITTTLTQTEMSDLTSVLSAFNEGTYAGWPHCDG